MSQAPTLNLLSLQVGRREGKFQIHIRVCQYGCGRIEGRDGGREGGAGAYPIRMSSVFLRQTEPRSNYVGWDRTQGEDNIPD